MSAIAHAAFHTVEPEKFGLKDIAEMAMDEATRLHNDQFAITIAGIRDKPDQRQITRAFAFAKLAQLADIAALDPDGFWNALRRVKAGGRF